MNKEQIAIELTKIYIDQYNKSMGYCKPQTEDIIKCYKSFLKELKKYIN